MELAFIVTVFCDCSMASGIAGDTGFVITEGASTSSFEEEGELGVAEGRGAAGGGGTVVAKTGLGGKLSLGSFSKGVVPVSSFEAVAGRLVFIYCYVLK